MESIKKKAEALYYDMKRLQISGRSLYGDKDDRTLEQCLLIVKMQKQLLLENLTPFVNLDKGARILDNGLNELDEIKRILKGIHYSETVKQTR